MEAPGAMQPEEGKVVLRLCTAILSGSLDQRLQALGGIGDCLIDSVRLEMKSPQLKRLVRTLVSTYLDSYTQVGEKNWRMAMQRLLARVTSAEDLDLPFSATEAALEVLHARRERPGTDASRVGLVDAALVLLATSASTATKEIESSLLALVAEQLLHMQDAKLEKKTQRRVADHFAKRPPSVYAAFAATCLAEPAGAGLSFVVAAALFPLLLVAPVPAAPKTTHAAAPPASPSTANVDPAVVAARAAERAAAKASSAAAAVLMQTSMVATRALLLEAVTRRVVLCKSPQSLSVAVLRKLGPFLQLLSAAEWGAGAEDGLEGSLVKTLKKAPEGAALLAAALAAQVQVDLSSFSQAGAAAAGMRMLRSQAPDARANGRTLLRSLVRKGSSGPAGAEAVAALAKLSVEALQGKGSGGALTQPWQRGEVATVLAVVAEVVAEAGSSGGSIKAHAAQLSSSLVLPALLAAIDKEPADDVRALLASAAGKWIALSCAAELPPAVSDALRAGLTKVKAQAYLLAMTQAVACGVGAGPDASSSSSSSSDVAERLTPVVQTLCSAAAKKVTAATQVDALLTLRLLAECAPFSTEIAAQAETLKLWAALTAEGSYLFNRTLHTAAASAVSAAGDGEESGPVGGVFAAPSEAGHGATSRVGSVVFVSLVGQSQMALVALAARRPLSSAFAAGDVPRGAVECVLSCLLQGDAALRLAAARAVSALVSPGAAAPPSAASSASSGPAAKSQRLLLQALWDHLCAASADHEAAAKARSLDFKASSRDADGGAGGAVRESGPGGVRLPAASWVAAAVQAMVATTSAGAGVAVGASGGKAESVWAVALLLCSHPLVNAGSRASAERLWAQACDCLGVGHKGQGADKGSSGAGAEVSLRLVRAAQSTAAQEQRAAQTALSLLAATGPWGAALARDCVLPALLASIDAPSLAALSEEEINAFLHPEMALAAANAAAAVGEGSVDLRITNADRKKDGPRSSRKGTFGSDFVEDEEWAERIRADKLKKATQARTGGDDPVEKKKAELAVLQERLGALSDKAARALGAVGALASGGAGRGGGDASSAQAAHRQLLAECLPTLLPALLQLLPCPLSEGAAHAALLQVCQHALEGDLQAGARDVADSLRVVARHVGGGVVAPAGTSTGKRAAREMQEWQQRHRRVAELSGPVLRLFKALALSLSRASPNNNTGGGSSVQPPSTAAVQLCFPVLHGLLQLHAPVPGCEQALALLTGLWPAGPALEPALRPLLQPLLHCCLSALANLRIEPSAEGVMLRALMQQQRGAGLGLEDWSPLLGDHGALNAAAGVRLACVRALAAAGQGTLSTARGPVSTLLPCRLFLATQDADEAVAALAASTWAEWQAGAAQARLPAEFADSLLPLLSHAVEGVRGAAAKALAQGLVQHPQCAAQVCADVQTAYRQAVPAPSRADDGFGFVRGGKGDKDKDLLPKKGAAAAAAPPSSSSDSKAPAADDPQSNHRISVALALAAMGAGKTLYNRPASAAASAADSPPDADRAALILQQLDFILSLGVVDACPRVRAAMVSAGRDFVDGFAPTLCSPMLAALDAVLRRKASKGEDLGAHDNRYEASVVLLGVAGKHLDKEDERVLSIAETLVDALSIPSEGVQRAVAEGLGPLVQAVKTNDKVKVIFETLMVRVTEGGTYGERRGAAFGISAFVKGMGITSLKQHDVVNRLRESCENGSVNARQGAFGAFECLSERLGMLFEPYITTIVPVLLKSFSHASDHVREAAQGAAKVIMGRLSAHGVKVVLTPILTSLPTETAWKTRQEAIRLLGTMAHCAPKQLASCLPQIVPRLVEAGYDPHPKVKESARLAMADISSVIKNPEVARLAPVLLAALSDPASKTKEALEALLECEFMHSIDAPSLALLVPILGRALKDRGADLKRRSAAITGNMMTMVGDPKFLLPYLPQVLPGLRDCLLDPIPDVRATSAKALGSLVSGVGEEEELAELVPWLTATLCTEASPVERSGAAQGLAEVCLALGGARMEAILTQSLPLHLSGRAAAREGLLWLLSFLPAVMREAYAPHIATTLPVVLTGLSDGSESVREVAMRAGQIMVATLGRAYTLDLLPSLCDGMFDEDWHIRHSSVMLLGELLYLIGDTKATGLIDGDEDNDDDGGMGNSSRVSITIRVHLGSATTDNMLASLYIARSDVSSMVRQAALQVWKSVVSNTPRTLVEIMNELVSQLIYKLAAESTDLRMVAGRALGEVVRKLGDRVLPAVVPHLRAGLEGGDLGMREGVCLGLAEILQASTRRQIEDYIGVLVPALQQGLCDPSEVVRSQAARAFVTLTKALGPRAIEDVLPTLVEQVGAAREEGQTPNMPMLGLREIVQAKSRDIVEYLLPRLLQAPMSAASAFVLGGIADVSGAVLQYHFGALLPALARELQQASEGAAGQDKGEGGALEGTENPSPSDDPGSRLAALKECSACVMGSINTAGVTYLFGDLGKLIEHETSASSRQWGCWLLEQFVRRSKANYLDYVQILLKLLLSRVAETHPPLLHAVSDALAGVGAALEADVFMGHIDFIRSCISSTASDARHSAGGHMLLQASGGGSGSGSGSGGGSDEVQLPLFSVPKALEPLLAVLIHGVMNGNPQVRENAADGIGELAMLTEPAALKAYLIKSTGPLIRAVGDRVPSNVKTSILQTLGILLDKGGPSLKAFAPQLQTTFVKALSDPSRQTRAKAVSALGKLMAISTRVDPLLSELSTLCGAAESNAIRVSAIDALATVLAKAGGTASAPVLEKIKGVTFSYLVAEDEALRGAASAVCGHLAAYAADGVDVGDLVLDLADTRGLKSEPVYSLSGRISSLGRIVQNAGRKLAGARADAFAYLAEAFKDDRLVNVCCAALVTAATPPDMAGAGAGAESRLEEHTAETALAWQAFAPNLCAAAGVEKSEECRKLALTAIKLFAQRCPEQVRGSAKLLLPPLLAGFRDAALYNVKALAERAFYHVSDGGSASAVSAFAQLLSGDDASYMRDYSKRVIARMPPTEAEEEQW